ncbi:hypothetical protein [Brevibacillus laterosporus]|uniref:Uncharacterized protein n=1 Tax=Brevibacillus laterosporus TaxID=1465 RepID=A0AAP3GAX7_BRELA|nr:hypothetical protein [Brevibacillus laterosporus]MCR8983076.1 hypothetical protein [Brevibacillus laterosporus]MCR8983100.1 hypothetical protein [Brevibacillus laterosporus]MCZ0810232.1 hypothetical protein [Brevibacillus laterosporus]MCZ0810256.1 hypothetical protein [Brevibacillus laterosporus]MCZ0829085.1 hypothetical protein [Brevibacillus laterosporus]
MVDFTLISKPLGTFILFVIPLIFRKMFEQETTIEKVERELSLQKYLIYQDNKYLLLIVIFQSGIILASGLLALLPAIGVYALFGSIIILIVSMVLRNQLLYVLCIITLTTSSMAFFAMNIWDLAFPNNMILHNSKPSNISSIVSHLIYLSVFYAILRYQLKKMLNKISHNEFLFVFQNGEVMKATIKSITRSKDYEVTPLDCDQNLQLSKLLPKSNNFQMIICRHQIQKIVHIPSNDKQH